MRRSKVLEEERDVLLDGLKSLDKARDWFVNLYINYIHTGVAPFGTQKKREPLIKLIIDQGFINHQRYRQEKSVRSDGSWWRSMEPNGFCSPSLHEYSSKSFVAERPRINLAIQRRISSACSCWACSWLNFAASYFNNVSRCTCTCILMGIGDLCRYTRRLGEVNQKMRFLDPSEMTIDRQQERLNFEKLRIQEVIKLSQTLILHLNASLYKSHK